jgi:hypothetical protein
VGLFFGKYQKNNKMIKKIIIAVLFIFVVSCKNNNPIFAQNKKIVNDTIKPKFLNKNSVCYSNSLKFSKKYGFVISDFYDVSEEQIFDIDEDLKKDTIVILSPLTLTPATDCELNNDKLIDNRILIISMSNGKIFLFDNVITNELGIGTLGAEFIKESKNGFILEKEVGQSCFFKYEIQIKYSDDKFIIQNIFLHSGGCPDNKTNNKKIDFSNKKYLLEKYNRQTIDSLKIVYKI